MESLVEASEITGEGEGYSSTESGWTFYLASPLHNDGNVHDDDDDDGELDSDVSAGFRHDSTGESRAEEDDSLASDASTGNIEKTGTSLLDDHVNRQDHDGYHGTNDGYSDHSTNVKEKVKKMERREGRRCFGGLFKSNGSSSSRSSKNWKTKLSW